MEAMPIFTASGRPDCRDREGARPNYSAVVGYRLRVMINDIRAENDKPRKNTNNLFNNLLT